MNRMQKLKGLDAASLRLKPLNDNPNLIYWKGRSQIERAKKELT